MNAIRLPRILQSLVFLLAIGTHSLTAAEFRAGAFAMNITPPVDVLLDGTIMKIGPAKAVHDELHARCIVLDDGKTKVAIVVIDNTMIQRSIHEDAKRIANRLTGIPVTHIMLSATHSHSTPRAVSIGQGEANEKYHRMMARKIAEGIQQAMKRLRPAKINWSSFKEPRFVHNRRWFFDPRLKTPNPFGETNDIVWMNPARGAITKPAGPVDPEVYVLGLQQADGTPLALLGNYGLHYVGGVPGGNISADYFGVFANKVADLLKAPKGFVGIMSNGTSGDVNAVDFKGPRKRYPAYANMTRIGTALAEPAVRGFKQAKFVSDLNISVAQKEIEFAVRKPDSARLAWARKVLAKAPTTGRPTRPVIYAREALGLDEFPDRVKIVLQAFRVGELAIAAIPNEVFAETGLAIKKGSPFKDTFVIELANGYNGYLPTRQQHKWGGYETWPARSSYLEVDAETKIRATILELLNQLKK
jgi:neutral ceramidase